MTASSSGNAPASAVPTAAQVRDDFIAFFRDRAGHAVVPSSPVVPHDDPTLLFTNAGMNQFKDVFLGTGSRDYTRAVDTQKCIRAGGKHNDLEDVGRDTYHHTFFEMLGNWSFGDYFKEDAIRWAWELLTGRDAWGIDPERLHVTVFGGDRADGLGADEEAEAIWREFVPEARIRRFDRKDNFWEMGDTGPCGPCSEIHYDGTEGGSGGPLVNADDPRVIEIWNLVFIQYERQDDGRLVTLPAKHVDTGMGLERIVRVLQGKDSNYDTDLWTPIFDAVAARSGVRAYGGRMDDPVDMGYRVIADHVRCLLAAIADGAAPGNEGRNYVLRRILRRASRHARQTFGATGPFLSEIVPAAVDVLGDAFPEMRREGDRVREIVRDEEKAFLRTIDRGIAHFDEAAHRATKSAHEKKSGHAVILADDAFRLHDTYGFPIDLTRVMATERGLGVDETGFESLMEKQRAASREGAGGEKKVTLNADAIARLRHLGADATDDAAKYGGKPTTARVQAIWNGRDFDEMAHPGREVAVVLDRTCCYAEAGGQQADHGRIHGSGAESPLAGTHTLEGEVDFEIEDVQRVGEFVLHVGRVVSGRLAIDTDVTVRIDRARREALAANHTATHLLNQALRAVAGEDADQKGSLVAPDRLRFDYAASGPLDGAQIAGVQRRVDDAIAADQPVDAAEVPLAQARAIAGVRAVFGEQYPDPVRVVSIGTPVASLVADPANDDWRGRSIEFCGGTHLASTGQAGDFVLLSEQGLAAGVRRVVAVTGAAAKAARLAAEDLGKRLDAADTLDGAELLAEADAIGASFEGLDLGAVDRTELAARIDALRERAKQVRKAHAKEAAAGIVDQARTIADAAAAAGDEVVVAVLAGGDKDAVMAGIDVLKSKCPDAAVMLICPDEEAGKVSIVARVAKPLIDRGLKAGDWVKVAAAACGGGGGGRPDMAQAGGKDPSRAEDARQAAEAKAREALG